MKCVHNLDLEEKCGECQVWVAKTMAVYPGSNLAQDSRLVSESDVE